MNRKNALFAAIFLLTACSRLDTLTPDLLNQAEAKWNASKPASYRLVVEMKGDRVEKERFDVTVRLGRVATLRRNGVEIQPTPDQDYSMDGLFRTLHLEIGLVRKPALLGAPEGYTAYPMAHFEDQTGRLLEYRRTVGGTSNTIDILVVEFQPL